LEYGLMGGLASVAAISTKNYPALQEAGMSQGSGMPAGVFWQVARRGLV
jgi:hypothetical protein